MGKRARHAKRERHKSLRDGNTHESDHPSGDSLGSGSPCGDGNEGLRGSRREFLRSVAGASQFPGQIARRRAVLHLRESRRRRPFPGKYRFPAGTAHVPRRPIDGRVRIAPGGRRPLAAETGGAARPGVPGSGTVSGGEQVVHRRRLAPQARAWSPSRQRRCDKRDAAFGRCGLLGRLAAHDHLPSEDRRLRDRSATAGQCHQRRDRPGNRRRLAPHCRHLGRPTDARVCRRRDSSH